MFCIPAKCDPILELSYVFVFIDFVCGQSRYVVYVLHYYVGLSRANNLEV
ncbi:hypothetical protein VIRA109638_08555 [Vibrio rarus]